VVVPVQHALGSSSNFSAAVEIQFLAIGEYNPLQPENLLAIRNFNWRPELFRDRGISPDTNIFPDFSIEQALRELKNRGLLRESAA
jgi:hypothetical protein